MGYTKSLKGRKVTVVGLGRFGGGVGVSRWLAGQGAKVTVSDQAGPEELAESISALNGLDVTLHLGGHQKEDFLGAELLVVNPAVPRDMPLLADAKQAGAAFTSEINLFIERCDAPIVGITGSVGKSTTTAMTGAILSQHVTTHVGGNIGVSLLESMDDIASDHVVVLELSSFQLEYLPLISISPHVAVVTNLTPNHLDRHRTMQAYADAKKNIFRFQRTGDVLVLNGSDKPVAAWAAEARGRAELFDPCGVPFELAVPGEHNQANAQAAWAAARQFGVSRAAAAEALRRFASLPHRLQFVVELGGVRYYNDSKCTTPGGAVVALEAFEAGKTIIIAGGYDKGVSFEAFGAAAAERAKAVIVLGATADKIAAAVESAPGGRAGIKRAQDLALAVSTAKELARPGDVVLLSPACASYDMFINYEYRGAEFVRLVTELNHAP